VGPRRSLVAAKLPTVHQVFGFETSFAQLVSLTRLRISNILREAPFWGIVILMAGIALNDGHYAGKAVAATVTPTPDHDLIDIGVFNGNKDEEKPLYLKKEWLTQPTQTFEFIVDQMPTRAGIDPYNKLIDRDSEDNWMTLTKQ
jgi:hypothetical protein